MWLFRKKQKNSVKSEEKRTLGNIWSYYPNARFGIFRRVLISFLLLSVIPLIILGAYTLHKIDRVGTQISREATQSLNRKIRDALELQAVLTARSVSQFLQQRIKDIHELSMIPRTNESYLHFSKQYQSEIWVRVGTNRNPEEVHQFIPLFKEVEFIDAKGNQRIKIKEDQIVPEKDLRNISRPQNTTYRCENYFNEAKKLAPGKVYVSHLNGFYVSKQEQLQGVERVEDAVQGKKYDGVIRFATPVYAHKKLIGVLALGLDHRHLMEFTQHILPNQKETVVFPSYYSGNYAFMFDDQGWIITHPKFWDIRGFDKKGKLVAAYTRHSTEEDIQRGRIPFNLDSAAFVHQNYPFVARQVRNGFSGSVITTNVGGTTKIMAYAPIQFNAGPYYKYGVFGGITIGLEIQSFQLPAFFIGSSIHQAITLMRKNYLFIILLIGLLSLAVSWMVSRGITNPVLKIVVAARELAFGASGKSLEVNRRDEIGVLATVFNFMAYELDKSRTELLRSYNRLQESKTKIENYANDLEYQIKILKSIQRISNILGSTFDMNEVIGLILQNCVQSIGYDRAILYLIDEEGKYLECKDTFGFSPEGDKIARRSRYNLERFDCIETKVARDGKIVFVEDFEHYTPATALDKKIRRYGRSNSFVFIPLKVKEKIIGILGADKLRSEETITEIDINSLQILANQASRVIESTRLYHQIVRQRNFVEDVLRNMVNGVMTISTEGVITSINRAARSILGVTKAGARGKRVWDVFSANKKEMQNIQQVLLDHGFYHGYNLHFYGAGQDKYLTVHASVMNAGRDGRGESIVIIEDVTDRKYLDEHLQRVERLASLGRFAAGIAHEIRNPLTGLSLFLDDLHDKISSEPEIATMVSMALNEIERLENLTHEVLNYANPQKGKYHAVNINELITSTLQFVAKQCKDANITVERELDETLRPLWIDAEKIRQALLNIFLNAIQAMKQGGKLIVRTENIEKTIAEYRFQLPNIPPVHHWVRISIKDTGPGIPKKDRERIFEPFFTKYKDGTGLGLSTTQTIIEEHKGQIQVKGKVGQGSVFVITLPAGKIEKMTLVE